MMLTGCMHLALWASFSLGPSYLSSVEVPLLMAIQDYGWFSHTDGEEPLVSCGNPSHYMVNF